MSDEPIDLTDLRLSADPVRRARLKARISSDTRAELARRARPATAARTLAGWFRPVLAGSGLLAAAAAAALLLTAPPLRPPVDEVFGVSPLVGVWLQQPEGPEVLELIVLFDGADR